MPVSIRECVEVYFVAYLLHAGIEFTKAPSPHLPLFLAGLFAGNLSMPHASSQVTQPDSFLNWMNAIAQQDLQQRAKTVRGIHTLADAERRKQFVRQELLSDIGGLPDYQGPLNPKITGEIPAQRFPSDPPPQHRSEESEESSHRSTPVTQSVEHRGVVVGQLHNITTILQ